MPEPPQLMQGDDHFWKRRMDGPSCVGINGYNSAVMRWFNPEGQVKRFVLCTSRRGAPVVAHVFAADDQELPWWAHWEHQPQEPPKEAADAPTA